MTQSISKELNIFVILFLVPIFSGVGEYWDMASDWYIVSLPLVLLWVCLTNCHIPNILKDHAFIFLVLLALFSLLVDFNAGLVTSLESLKETDTWSMLLSILICFQLIVMRVNYSSFIAAIVIGVMVFYFHQFFIIITDEVSYDSFFGGTGFSYVAATASLILFMAGKRFLPLVLMFFIFPMMTRGVGLAFLIAFMFYYIIYVKNIQISRLMLTPRVIVLIIIAALFLFEVAIGLFFHFSGASFEWQTITSGRSLFYSIILTGWLTTGLNTLLPVSSVFSSDLISEYTLHAMAFGNLMFGNSQCPHSLLIEFAVDYGIIALFVFITGLIMSAPRLSIIAVLYFLVFSAFQCENFSPMFFVPFYIFYRVLIDDEWRFIPNVRRINVEKVQ